MKYLFILCYCGLHLLFYAQKNIIEFYQYSTNEGLVDNWVNDFDKDQNGFLWIATNDGISRFDGYNFVNFSSKSHTEFSGATIINDIQIVENKLYATSSDKGIFSINLSNYKVEHIEKKGVYSYYRNNKFELICYVTGDVVLKKNGKYFSSRKFHETLRSKALIQGNRIILNKGHTSLFVLDLKMNLLHQSKIIDKAKNLQLINHPKFGVLFSTSRGSVQLKKDEFELFGKLNLKNSYTYFNLTKDGKPYYIINSKEPVMPLRTGNYTFTIDKKQNVEMRTMFHLGQDYWLIGTNQGFYKLNISERFNKQIDDLLFEENQIRVRRRIIPSSNSLYFFGFPGIVEHELLSNKQTYRSAKEFVLSNYDAVKQNHLIYSTSEGLGFWELNTNNEIMRLVTSKHISEKAFFNCVVAFNSNNLLLGGRSHLVLYNTSNNSSKKFSISNKIDVYDIWVINENSLLLATNLGLYSGKIDVNKGKLRMKKLKDKYKEKNYPIRCLDIHYSSKNKKYFIATDEGLLVLNNKLQMFKRFNEANGLNNRKVTGILEDFLGNIWISTFSGITCINNNLTKTYNLSEKHGLINSEYNYKAFAKLDNEELIFGGLYGYDVISPWLFDFGVSKSKILLSEVILESASTKETTLNTNSQTISFNTGKEDLYLTFCSSDFNGAEMYSFEYQIDNRKWEKFSSKNTLRISNLSAGRHHLKIRMRDSFDNICHEKWFFIKADIPFYQETFFYFLSILLILTLSALSIYYFYQIRNIEIETKKRIAMDLHDETGTILTRLLLFTKNENMFNSNKETFKQGLNEALYSLRTFMYSLTGKKVKVNDLMLDIREFVNLFFTNSGIKGAVIQKNISNKYLSSELVRDIKLCVYESMQNSLKHSSGDTYQITFSINNNVLVIEISDNGYSDYTLAEMQKRGNGLKNFKKRAIRHKGEFSFNVDNDKKSVHLNFKFPL
jgi:signal transduction histidine kinase